MTSTAVDLENEALEARLDLALYRSFYSKSCGNWFRQYLKNDFMASTTFEVKLEENFGPFSSQDDNAIERLHLRTKIPDPYTRFSNFEQQLSNVSKALDMVVKHKGK